MKLEDLTYQQLESGFRVRFHGGGGWGFRFWVGPRDMVTDKCPQPKYRGAKYMYSLWEKAGSVKYSSPLVHGI